MKAPRDGEPPTYVVMLLLGFCTLIIAWRIEGLYDLVRTCVVGLLTVYFTWRVMARDSSKGHDHDSP
jgi:hypothetical protein